MARYKRIYSETGIYHVMTRGNDKSDIFIDKWDCKKYLDILSEKKEDLNYYLYAFCIMRNHSHLIIKEEEDSLSNIMKRINISYASYFNKKYGRIGHVFQDRYRSEPIEDDRYLLTATRYIHNNPVKANIVRNCEDYPWSSYNYYTGKFDDKGLVETDFVSSIFSEDSHNRVKSFIDFSSKENDDCFIDILTEERPTMFGYIDANKYINKYLESQNLNIEDLKRKEVKKKRDELITYLRKNSDLSIRDIAKLLNLAKSTVGDAK